MLMGDIFILGAGGHYHFGATLMLELSIKSKLNSPTFFFKTGQRFLFLTNKKDRTSRWLVRVFSDT